MNTDTIKGTFASLLILAFVAMCIYCCIDTLGKTEYDDTGNFIVRCNEIYGVNNWTVETIDPRTSFDYYNNVIYNHDHSKVEIVTMSFDNLISHPVISIYDKCFFCEPNITRYTCFSKHQIIKNDP